MTETDKARGIAKKLFEAVWHKSQHGRIIATMAEILEMELKAYGAAQYEAGAAQMRERAAKKLYPACRNESCDIKDHATDWRKVEAVRALPLREKD